MKIAHDEQMFVLQQYGGVSRYHAKLIENLNNIDNTNAKAFAPFHQNFYLGKLQKEYVKGYTLGAYPLHTRFIFKPFNRIIGTRLIRKWSPDILHLTYYDWKGTFGSKCKIAVTIHDMIYEKYPELFENSQQVISKKKYAVDKADLVICVSQSTKNDLLEITGVDEEKVKVIYHGFDKIDLSEKEISVFNDRFNFDYILYIGHRKKYKNFDLLLKAYSNSKEINNHFKILAFGGGKIDSEEQAQLKDLGISNNVIHLAGDDRLLALSYRNAHCLVYPSLYEGFGLPILEAMSQCCPVILSNVSSLPEVGGNAALYFDAQSSDQLKACLMDILFDDSLRESLSKKGLAQCDKFSWDICANQTNSAYQNIL